MRKLQAIILAVVMIIGSFGINVYAETELPTATTTKLNVSEIKEVALTFAMNFLADEASEAQLAEYGDWYADYVLTINKDLVLNEDGTKDGYLAGQYDAWAEAFIAVPFEDTEVKANEPVKVMQKAAEMMGNENLKYTYKEVYEYVKDFDCGVYFSNEFIAANPDLKVTLELRIYNNENEEESYAIGKTEEFEITVSKTDEDVSIKADTAEDSVIILDMDTSSVTEETDTIVIDTSKFSSTNVSSVSIPTQSITEISEKADLEVTVANEEGVSTGSIKLDKTALLSISAAAQNAGAEYIKLQVAPVSEETLVEEQKEAVESLSESAVYELGAATNDGTLISDLGEGIMTASVYYEKTRTGTVMVQKLNADGTLEDVEYSYDDETNLVTLALDESANYVVYTEPSKGVSSGSGGGAGSSSYLVKFETNGAEKIANQVIRKNQTASEPEEPLKEGFVFGGWFADEECTKEYDFSSVVTKDIVIYAKWISTEPLETEEPTETEEPIETEEPTETEEPIETEEPTEEPSENEFPFKDVKETDWFFDAVKFVFDRGITKGVADDSFAPDSKVTRGQFITILCRAYKIEEMTGDNFDDCGDTWYTGYLAAAKQLGISKGIGENKFAPEREITREEMVNLIYNYLVLIGEADTVETDTVSFDDAEFISDWAKESVAYAVSKGIVSGRENKTFDPSGYATRAELAQIFYNMFK